jgi:uncharacterized membrane protein
MRRFYISARVKLGMALGVSSLTSVGLYIAGVWGSHERDFGFMMWNLFLAWLALAITLWLERTLNRSLWSSWYALAMTALWIVFLPNTFYMITDLIHVQELTQTDLMYGVVMLASFIFNGVMLGLISLYIVHWELQKRLKARTAYILIELSILVCSFAIYIGRELRWNTWDILVNPAALLFDASDRIINVQQHPRAVTITLSFFILISTAYAIVLHIARAARQQRDLPGK